jgi:hypothetical protein
VLDPDLLDPTDDPGVGFCTSGVDLYSSSADPHKLVKTVYLKGGEETHVAFSNSSEYTAVTSSFSFTKFTKSLSLHVRNLCRRFPHESRFWSSSSVFVSCWERRETVEANAVRWASVGWRWMRSLLWIVCRMDFIMLMSKV